MVSVDQQQFSDCTPQKSECDLLIFQHLELDDHYIKRAHGKGNAKAFNRFCFECGVEKGIYTPGNRVVKDGIDMICCGQCRRVRKVQFCSRCFSCSSCLRLSESGTGHASAATDVVDILLGLSNRTALNNAACPRCGHRTIQGKAPEPKRWYNNYDQVTALGMAWSMAEFEAVFGETASPEWFDGDDFCYKD